MISKTAEYTFEKEYIKKEDATRYKLMHGERYVPFSEFACNLSSRNEQLIELLMNEIIEYDCPVFWECKPTTQSTF